MSCHRTIAVLTAALVIGASAAAAEVAVTGPSAATPGGTLTVAVTLSPDLNNVYALQAGLVYDPAVLTPLPESPATPGGAYAGTPGNVFPGETIPRDADLFRMNASQAGLIVLGYVKNPSDPAGSPSTTVPATALQVTFNVAAEATGETTVGLGSYTLNGSTMAGILLGTRDGTPVAATVAAPLKVSLGTPGRHPGDANDDAEVSLADVLLQLQAAGGTTGIPQLNMSNADVWPASGADGRITLEDAVRTWRFVSGLEAGLG